MNTSIVTPSSEDIEDIRKIFSQNGFPRSEVYNSYVYREREGRKPICCFYYSDDKLGGMYAVVPVRFKLGNESLDGYQSLDTMVDKEHRGKGLFQLTANETYKHLLSNENCLVYGFPNGNSYLGFKKYLDWNFLDPLPFIIRPINIGFFVKNKFLKKLLSYISIPVASKVNCSVEYYSSFPDANGLDAVCAEFVKSYKVGVLRDLDYLKSRYLYHPEKQYSFVLSKDSSTGLVNGLGIYSIENKHGGKIGYVMDLIYHPNSSDASSSLLSSILIKMKEEKCDCVLAWCFPHSSVYKTYKKNWFLVMPEKIRPIELHFGYKVIGDFKSVIFNDRKSWYLSYSDSDTV